MDIIDKLHQVMETKNLSGADVARAIECDRSMVTRILSRNRKLGARKTILLQGFINTYHKRFCTDDDVKQYLNHR